MSCFFSSIFFFKKKFLIFLCNLFIGLGDFVIQYEQPESQLYSFPPYSFVILKNYENYQHLLVSNICSDRLWIFSRSPFMNDKVLQTLIQDAKELGIPVDQLVLKETKGQACIERE